MGKEPGLNVITGAFGFTGRYMARILLERGDAVKTLTGHPERADLSPFKEKIEAFPLNLENTSYLRKTLEGVNTVYNTYWIRFDYGKTTFERAVENSRNLINAAKEAKVKRFVHISIANADELSPSRYYSGKGRVERHLMESGLSYAIVRPTLVFGPGDILINNIAWLLRNFPVFAVPGAGDYKVQPVYVGDVAELCIEAASKKENMAIDAAGPEVFSYMELVSMMRAAVKSRSVIVRLPSALAYLLSIPIDLYAGDVIVTRDEISELMKGVLVSSGRPACKTRFSAWLEENAGNIGLTYASELKRHYTWRKE
jgi:NADH dehydrogenase